MKSHIKFLSLLPLLLSFGPVAEIYKCTDSRGKITYQDTICQAGNEEQVDTKSKKTSKAPNLAYSTSNQYDTRTKADMERAVRGGFYNRIKSMLSSGVSPNIVFDEGRNAKWRNNPLLIASRQSDTYMVKLLLQFGADANYADSTGETPLLAAVRKDHVEIVSMLLNAGADVNHIDGDGRPILFRAVDYNRIKTLPLLLQAGAELNSKMAVQDKGGPYTVAEYFTKVKPAPKIVLVTLGLVKEEN